MTVFLVLIGIAAVAACWEGFVLKTLWAWFVVPTFGLPVLSLPVAIGLSLVVGYLTHQYIPKDNEDFLEIFKDMFLYPLVALVVGLIVSLFV